MDAKIAPQGVIFAREFTAIGGVTGLVVSFLVFLARAHILVIEAAASMLMAGVLPELLAVFTQWLDGTAILRRQHSIGLAFTRLDAIGAEATRERMAYLALEPDPGPLCVRCSGCATTLS